tara:strand:- start:3120 stop:3281 length:162 start_codon:yes stop_codon:yes gene_type:complete
MPEKPAPTIADDIRARRIADLKSEIQTHEATIERQKAEIEVKSAQLAALSPTK